MKATAIYENREFGYILLILGISSILFFLGSSFFSMDFFRPRPKKVESEQPVSPLSIDSTKPLIQENLLPQRKHIDQPFPLDISCLVKTYPKPKTIALNNLSVYLEQNEIFGLLGPNGAGKTTLMSILSGSNSYDSGVISIYGQNVENARSLLVPSSNLSIIP